MGLAMQGNLSCGQSNLLRNMDTAEKLQHVRDILHKYIFSLRQYDTGYLLHNTIEK